MDEETKNIIGLNSTTAYWLGGLTLSVIGVFGTLIFGLIPAIIGIIGIVLMIISVVKNAKSQAATGLKISLIVGKIIWIIVITLMQVLFLVGFLMDKYR